MAGDPAGIGGETNLRIKPKLIRLGYEMRKLGSSFWLGRAELPWTRLTVAVPDLGRTRT